MRKALLFLLMLGLCWFSSQVAGLYAQEGDYYDDDDDDIDADADYWGDYMPELYARGDQTFTISLGVLFPAIFLNNGKQIPHHFDPPVGGALGPLAYTFFLNGNFFVGGELGFSFAYTLGQSTVFIIPVGVRAGWQFIIRRIEIPLTVTIGIAPQKYLNKTYVGLFTKAGLSAFYRFNPEWSFGLNADWSWYPQWPRENGELVPHKNVDGNVIGLTLAARYHF